MHNIRYHQEVNTMKHVSAIITALVITAVVGLGIMVIGVNALTNTNTVPLQNSPNASSTGNNLSTTNGNISAQSTSTSSDVQQLQQQVSDLQSQLSQAGQMIQQYQSLIVVLQQRGVISIDQNGNIYLPQGGTTIFH
jgi:peptidoglycan hydrolase CwlO-like protein